MFFANISRVFREYRTEQPIAQRGADRRSHEHQSGETSGIILDSLDLALLPADETCQRKRNRSGIGFRKLSAQNRRRLQRHRSPSAGGWKKRGGGIAEEHNSPFDPVWASNIVQIPKKRPLGSISQRPEELRLPLCRLSE
jgi:hypothetical protein